MNTEYDLTTPVGREEYFNRQQAEITRPSVVNEIDCDLMTAGGREEYFSQQQALIEDQRLPWQKEGWVDPYARYNELQEQLAEFLRIDDSILIMLRDGLEQKLKEQQPTHNWVKEGF